MACSRAASPGCGRVVHSAGPLGHHELRESPSAAIELAENGYPLSEVRARLIARTEKIRKYPTTVRIYLPNGQAPKAGEIFRNPDLARTLKKLVEAEKENQSSGRHAALKAARDRFYKGDIAREFAAFSESNGGLSAIRTLPITPPRSRRRSPSTIAVTRFTRILLPVRALPS